jgi:hypothetical protein
LSAGKVFLGIAPPRPLKVLYVDFESHDGVIVDHLQIIGTHSNLDFLEPDDLVRGPKLIEALKGLVQAAGYDLVIIDPLTDAYPVEDENDNSEAVRQMLAFRDLARAASVGVVVIHNIGRRGQHVHDEEDAFLGRGASARPEKADVSINFLKDPDEPETRRILKVAKSRQPNLHQRIVIRFAGVLGYELADPKPDRSAASGTVKTATRCVEIAQSEKNAGRAPVTREMFRTHLELTTSGADQKALTRALDHATKAGWLVRLEQGQYDLPPLVASVDEESKTLTIEDLRRVPFDEEIEDQIIREIERCGRPHRKRTRH